MKSFLDVDNRLERLTNMGDTLVRLEKAIKWEIFRPILDEIYYSEDNRSGGRRAYDRILMFKILILQILYNIADDATEYQINDRLSFQRFLGLDIGDKVPDAKTIWLYREKLVKSGRERELFDLYNEQLEKAGLITRTGSIIDATFVERPRQRGDGKSPEPKNINRERQLDKDARGAKKNNKSVYGFKNHIKVDTETKIIISFSATAAARHDGKEAPNILDERDKNVYADAIYRGKEIEDDMQKAAVNAKLHIVRKHDGYHEPTEEQENENITIQKIRQRVEHVFGYMVKAMGGKQVRSCGLPRARVAITLKNLAYNMRRTVFLMS